MQNQPNKIPKVNTLAQCLTLPNGTQIKNRLVKSSMSEALGTAECSPTSELTRLYKRWADGGIGLSITGNVMIDRRALGEPGNVVIEDDRDMDALRQWAQAATSNGTQCWVQLNHPGKQSPRGMNEETVSPSAVAFTSDMKGHFAVPRELRDEEIRSLIHRYGVSAALVKQAGFSGVQIHGAHGYLVGQFLSSLHNLRTDNWGGSPENRRRFVMEVYRSIRDAVGPGFPVGIKLNSADFQRGGFTEEESLNVIRALAEAGIDLIEISGGTYESPAMTGVEVDAQPVKESTRLREAYFLDFAEKARKAVKTPLVLTGGFRTVTGMHQAIDSGAVDMVGLARILAMEPDVPQRLLAGQEAMHCVKPIQTGIKSIDKLGILEVTWYTSQLKRIGKGLPPKPRESALWAFIKLAWHLTLISKKKRTPMRHRAS